MDPTLQHMPERRIDRALAVDAALAGKGFGLDFHREMAFAAAVVAGMAVMLRAVVEHGEAGGGQGGAQPFLYLAGDRAG